MGPQPSLTPATDLIVLKAAKEEFFKTPPIEWIAERVDSIQEVLARRVEKSALIFQKLLGKIRLEPVSRTVSEIPIKAAILGAGAAPVYPCAVEKGVNPVVILMPAGFRAPEQTGWKTV